MNDDCRNLNGKYMVEMCASHYIKYLRSSGKEVGNAEYSTTKIIKYEMIKGLKVTSGS